MGAKSPTDSRFETRHGGDVASKGGNLLGGVKLVQIGL